MHVRLSEILYFLVDKKKVGVLPVCIHNAVLEILEGTRMTLYITLAYQTTFLGGATLPKEHLSERR